MNNNNNHHQQQQQIMPLNIKYLRTRFTLRFLRALKQINNNGYNNDDNDNDNLKVSKRHKKVKLAADTSLALTAGPGRAWARAIIMRARPRSHRVQRVTGRIKRRVRSETGRAEELRRLVPGGEDMKDMKSLLDETLDYIMCLTTQVNVMRGIVDVCSNNNSS